MSLFTRPESRKIWVHRVSVLLLLVANSLEAGQDRDSNTAGGLNASVDLRHRVVIPQILYFRVGSDTMGTIDEVRFDVNPTGTGVGNNQSYTGSNPVPIGNGAPIAATANGVLPVYVLANVGSLTLSYDISDTSGLTDGAGNYIPFDDILVVSADPANLPTPVLSNTGGGGVNSVNITGNLFGGRVTQLRTTWTYTYANTRVPVAGKYTGRVRYTAAAP